MRATKVFSVLALRCLSAHINLVAFQSHQIPISVRNLDGILRRCGDDMARLVHHRRVSEVDTAGSGSENYNNNSVAS